MPLSTHATTLSLALLTLAACSPAVSNRAITLHPLPPSSFQNATAPGALWRACAADESTLATFLGSKRLPFVPALVTRQSEAFCHILYEPSLPGFRASPDNAPIAELLVNVNAPSFFAPAAAADGDGLHVLTQILPYLHRSIQVTLGVGAALPEALALDAIRYHFPNSIHRFQIHSNRASDYDPWAQDFLKFGLAGNIPRFLVTRQAYEGQPAMGRDMKPMLDSFQSGRYVPSKLSWEGGDLQFALNPRDPSKTILFYGSTAKRYWGGSLTAAEFEYVLQVEFGADQAVYLADATPHVDYTLAVLPADQIALVSEPVCNDLSLARAAAKLLLEHHREATPPELTQLAGVLNAANPLPETVGALLQRARQLEPTWRRPADSASAAQISAFVEQNCPGQPAACLQDQHLTNLLTQRPSLLRTWVQTGRQEQVEAHLSLRLLQIIESQLRPCPRELEQRTARNAEVLQNLGFRIVRVPLIPGTGDSISSWAGLAYVNSLVIDRHIFLPSLGLPGIEQTWLMRLKQALPDSYSLTPIVARAAIFSNGGLHCLTAIARHQ